MSPELQSRLENWKFASAMQYIDGEPENVENAVSALSEAFGDCGWFGGRMGVIVGAAVDGLLEREVK
jgi:hypothetical protein